MEKRHVVHSYAIRLDSAESQTDATAKGLTQHGNSELETHPGPASSLAPASYISVVGGRWFGKLGDMGFSSQFRT